MGRITSSIGTDISGLLFSLPLKLFPLKVYVYDNLSAIIIISQVAYAFLYQKCIKILLNAYENASNIRTILLYKFISEEKDHFYITKYI